MKLNWQYFLLHAGELVASEFSKTVMGKVLRHTEVVAVKVVGEDLYVFLKGIPAYIFREGNTWVFMNSQTEIHLKRDRGEEPLTTFEFRLRAPFPILEFRHHVSPAG
jgi:hypothetical protein